MRRARLAAAYRPEILGLKGRQVNFRAGKPVEAVGNLNLFEVTPLSA